MSVCDVCSRQVPDGDGYSLTTQQVVTVPEYWMVAFFGIEAAIQIMPDEMVKQTFDMQLQQQCGQSTGWLVCEDCIAKFPEVDKDQAKANIKEWHEQGAPSSYCPPGGGPVETSVAMPAASQAWKAKTGKTAPGASAGATGCLLVIVAVLTGLSGTLMIVTAF